MAQDRAAQFDETHKNRLTDVGFVLVTHRLIDESGVDIENANTFRDGRVSVCAD